MHKTEPQYTIFETALEVSELPCHIKSHLDDARIRQLSPRTIHERAIYLNKLIWFQSHYGHSVCDTQVLRSFFSYLTVAHEDPRGRWDDTRQRTALRPVTIRSYYTQYTFFNWLVEEGVLEVSPMSRIRSPRASADQINSFADGHLVKIERAAATSGNSRRDITIVHLLLDSGMCAAELCSLTYGNFDLHSRRCTVLGKGNKKRTVYFGRLTRKALWNYLKEQPRESHDPVFLADRGRNQKDHSHALDFTNLLSGLGARPDCTHCAPWRK